MQDCNKPRPSHVMKEGRHRGEERWTGSLLRRFVRCSASSSSRCSSSSVPFAITAHCTLHVLEKVESRVNTAYFGLMFGVQFARTLYCEQRYASIGVAQCHARTPRWLERRIVNPPLQLSKKFSCLSALHCSCGYDW